ncbi:hypothetical protein PVAR5_0618 [Paecilomyces variotii No. 5]|uniref:Uncharacterized protein n=1 Tax=Byssochlamys spectabilis (strain No. 5 / NBRC 109023) TaxID=1356009 RepID=V5FTV5_BYSSN|nr:hypothetical protein PVAR5_0618 [Paecilomyces variotii No. 5]
MSQSRKEGENRPGTPFPGRGPDNWDSNFRNQVEALTIGQRGNQGQNQSQGHPAVILRPELDIPLMHSVPTRALSDQRPLPFNNEPFQRPRAGASRNQTEGIWIGNGNRTRVAPHLHSPTHIEPSPLGRDYDMEMLAAMMATAFYEQQDVTNVTAASQGDVDTQSRGQADASGHSTADSGRGFGNLGVRDIGDEMDES